MKSHDQPPERPLEQRHEAYSGTTMAVTAGLLFVLAIVNSCDPRTQQMQQEIERQRQLEDGNSAPTPDTVDPYWTDVDPAAVAAASLLTRSS